MQKNNMMKLKNLSILVVLTIIYSSCGSHKQVKDKNVSNVVLHINMNNYNGNKAFIQGTDKKVYEIKKIDNGKFVDTLQIPEGYYKLNLGREFTNVYLTPGDNLNISLDAEKFDETMHYEGKGAEENNYLAKKLLLTEKLTSKKNMLALYGLDEAGFLKKQKSINEQYKQLLAQSQIKNKNFLDAENKAIKIKNAITLLQYPDYKRYLSKNNNFKVSKSYPDTSKDIDVNDEKLLKIPCFIDYATIFVQKEIIKNISKPDDAKPINRLKKLNSLITNKKIRENLAFNMGMADIEYVSNIDDYVNLYKTMVTNPTFLKPLEQKAENLKKVHPGADSPDFKAFDINGKEYHLKDFAGKLLYIDLWATWCAPCRAEIPYLEKLKKEYNGKNINFLSIDVYDQKAKWEQMMKTGKLTGNQLISTDRNMNFLKVYSVTGIPRFILLDENGKIISQNAMRPSNPQLKQLINQHLNK